MIYGEWLSMATGSNDMKIRNGQLIIPDFGVTYIPAIGYKGRTTHILRPQVGINIMFRPIDKTQRLQTIENPSFWHHGSLYLGLTLGKINVDDFTDLSSTFSLVSGVNYRLSRQIRLGVGALHLRIEDENPLISKTHWRLAPYGAVSFDLDIFENIGRFITKVFN